MTYHFSKIITSRIKPQYGNFITNEHYMVIDNEDEVGQYFVTQKMDYFNFLDDELEMYSITHLPTNGKRIITNEINNKVVGYYESCTKKDKIVSAYGEIVLADTKYNCTQMPIAKNTTHKNVMVSNDVEQVFISCEEKKNKIDTNIVEVLHGTIEMTKTNVLLLFTSIYFLEEMLFIGNAK
jgi:phage anti-repressor protein